MSRPTSPTTRGGTDAAAARTSRADTRGPRRGGILSRPGPDGTVQAAAQEREYPAALRGGGAAVGRHRPGHEPLRPNLQTPRGGNPRRGTDVKILLANDVP